MKGLKAYVLNLGRIKIDVNKVLAHKVHATVTDPNPALYMIDLPCFGVLVEHPTAGKFIFDLGANPDAAPPNENWPKEWWNNAPYFRGEGENMLAQLALCGTVPGDVSTVVLSHLHWDHTGYLHLFEHCDVYAAKKELEFSMPQIHSGPSNADGYPCYKPDLMVPVKRWVAVSDEEEEIDFLPGVHLVNLPGHTYGLLGMILELESGTVFFPADALYLMENLTIPAGAIRNAAEYEKTMKKIKKYAAKYNAEIIPGHDIHYFMEKMKKAPDCYQ